MTPTLRGRWQTRLLLMATVGILVSLLFALLYADFETPLIVLGLALLLGFGWDMIYHTLQNFRWDGDWPPLFYCVGCALEGASLWVLTSSVLRLDLTLGQFVAHSTAVWLTILAVMFGPLKVLLPRWRFRGGEWF